MCQMVSNVCGSFTGGISSFFSGGWEQAKIIGEIAKKVFSCDFQGALDSFSSTNLGGKILFGVIGLGIARTIYQMLYSADKNSEPV